MADPNGFLQELKRRKVFRVAAVYAVVGWALIEFSDTTFPQLALPAWAPTLVLILVLMGFPVALVLAWALELTPEGVRRSPPGETGHATESDPPEAAVTLGTAKAAGVSKARWTASRIAVVGAGVILGIAGGAFLATGGRDDSATHRTRVAVLPLENRTGDPALDVMGEMAADWITNGLVRAEISQVVPFENILAITREDPEKASRLQHSWPDETGATMAFQGAIYATSDSVQFTLRIVDPDGQVLASTNPVLGERSAPSESLGPLQVAAAGALARLVDPNNELAWTTLGRHAPNPEAHQAFLEALTVFHGDPNAASRPLLERAIDLDPDYLNPVMLLMVTYANAGPLSRADSLARVLDARRDELAPQERLQLSMDWAWIRGDIWECYQASKRLAEEYHPSWYYRVGLHARELNLPQAAVEAYEKWDPYAGRSAREWAPIYWHQYSVALHMLGEHERELEIVRRARSEHPERGFLLRNEAIALAALNRSDEAEAVIAELLASPGATNLGPTLSRLGDVFLAFDQPDAAERTYRRGLEWQETREDTTGAVARGIVAMLTLRLGRFDEAHRRFEALRSADAEDINAITYVGVAAALEGDTATARRMDAELAAIERPFDRGTLPYLRANILAVIGNREEAVALLRRAFSDGRSHTHWDASDPEFANLRGYEPFEELIRPQG